MHARVLSSKDYARNGRILLYLFVYNVSVCAVDGQRSQLRNAGLLMSAMC